MKMSKRAVLLSLVMGMLAGVLVIHPLVFSIYLYEEQNNSGSWLAALAHAYKSIFSFQDWKHFLMGVLYGLLGVAFGMRMAAERLKLQVMSELQLRFRILELVRQGENALVTFKPGLQCGYDQASSHEPRELGLAKCIAGFMNTHGGHLFIGVDDKGNLLGLEQDYLLLRRQEQQSLLWITPDRQSPLRVTPDREAFHQHLRHMVTALLDSSCLSFLKVDFCEVEGRDICHVLVKQARSAVYVHIGDRSHFFVRTGSKTIELDVIETLGYIELLKTKYRFF